MKRIIKKLTFWMLTAAFFLLLLSFTPSDEIRGFKTAKIEKITKQQIFVFIDNDPAEAEGILLKSEDNFLTCKPIKFLHK